MPCSRIDVLEFCGKSPCQQRNVPSQTSRIVWPRLKTNPKKVLHNLRHVPMLFVLREPTRAPATLCHVAFRWLHWNSVVLALAMLLVARFIPSRGEIRSWTWKILPPHCPPRVWLKAQGIASRVYLRPVGCKGNIEVSPVCRARCWLVAKPTSFVWWGIT